MAASAQGAKQAGGKTIGVTCKAFSAKANPFIDEEISTDNLDERLHKLIELGSAYGILPGGTGTLLELATVLELTNKKFLERRPVILVGAFWQPVTECIARDDPRCRRLVQQADTPEQAVAAIAAHLASC